MPNYLLVFKNIQAGGKRRRKRRSFLKCFLIILFIGIAVAAGVVLISGTFNERQLLNSKDNKKNKTVSGELQSNLSSFSSTIFLNEAVYFTDKTYDQLKNVAFARRDVFRPSNKDISEYEGFFENSVFLGDSITEGLIFYGGADGATIVANKGMNLKQASEKLDKIAKTAPEKLYILLGINDMTNYNMPLDDIAIKYHDFLIAVKEKLPECEVYVQSVFPLADKYDNSRTKLTNEKINEFNKILKNTIEDTDAHYIDVAVCLKDEYGKMYKHITADGLHIKASYYPFWLRLLAENSK